MPISTFDKAEKRTTNSTTGSPDQKESNCIHVVIQVGLHLIAAFALYCVHPYNFTISPYSHINEDISFLCSS
ncbi:hypothetical protein L596_019006 [Steinernema carpocapsae]|uniref:Uncharacterized protein n=1 Tax=Steinernema carpocapsae TaxID=34508 RepID=A0A4U5N7W5_STECR|nr:hypothetical protein L596_019006 [Steinernema carpocapsae]